jgi:hypothetical protein
MLYRYPIPCTFEMIAVLAWGYRRHGTAIEFLNPAGRHGCLLHASGTGRT